MKGTRRSWLARAALFAVVLPLIAACGDDATAPVPDIDPAQTEAALQQVIDQYFTDNPGLLSLEEFQAAIGNALPSIAPNFTLHPESSLFGLADRMGASMRAAYAHGNSLPMLMANIPTEFLGTTFVYNPQADPPQYEPSPDRTGAPADGVRFILYDNLNDLNEIGHFDLTDNSNFAVSPATIDVTFEVIITAVSSTTPVVYYEIGGTVSDTDGDLSVTGFLSDGTGQLDFDFQVQGTDAAGYGAAFGLSAGDLSVTLTIADDVGTGIQELGATISDGTDTIEFLITIDAVGDVQGGSGIFFNDVPVATFSGNVEQDTVTLTNTGGDPLTQQELVALANIFVALEEAFTIMEGLFAFGLALVGVSFFF